MSELIPMRHKEYEDLKSAYDIAVEKNERSFTLEIYGKNREFVTDYAKYMLEYLAPKFDK